MVGEQAKLNAGGKEYAYPVVSGSVGPDVIDIRKLYGETGMFTFDPGFTSAAACESALTYIDGDEGVLLHRGYPIGQLAEGQIDRREFLRYATLLGLSAPAAYAAVRAITGERLVGEARAQGTPPKGGTLRIGMRCQDVKDPHSFSWVEPSPAQS